MAEHMSQTRDTAAVTSFQYAVFHEHQNVFAVLTRKHRSSSSVAANYLALFRIVDADCPGAVMCVGLL